MAGTDVSDHRLLRLLIFRPLDSHSGGLLGIIPPRFSRSLEVEDDFEGTNTICPESDGVYAYWRDADSTVRLVVGSP